MNRPQHATHEALMERFKTQLDKAAFEQLVWDYASPAAAVAYQILGDRFLAEDAVQEAFIRIIKKRNQYVLSRPFSCWFYVILRHVCIDMLRQRKREQEIAKRFSNTFTHSTHRELKADYAVLLRALAPPERSVLELRVVHSMSFKEIAAALDISEEAAKKRAQRGLRKLRQKFAHSEFMQRQAV